MSVGRLPHTYAHTLFITTGYKITENPWLCSLRVLHSNEKKEKKQNNRVSRSKNKSKNNNAPVACNYQTIEIFQLKYDGTAH